MKKKIIIPLILILGISVIASAWFFEYDKEVTGKVLKTGKKLNLIYDFSDYIINTSTSLTNYQNLTIDNKKDPRMVIFTITTNKTLTEPMCPNFTGDCSVEFWNETSQILNGTSYIIPKGILLYSLNTTCVPYSCGQNISTHIEIKEP